VISSSGDDMFGRTGVAELECDAPPYSVVAACSELGFQSPLDVPWWRVSRLQELPRRESGRLRSLVRKLLAGSDAGPPCCCCGKALPTLVGYTFTFISQRQASYLIAQCSHCRAVYWDEA
jgi:hypothetical protein